MRYMKRMNAPVPTRERIARHRSAQRERGLRAVTIWLPNVNDPAYRARIADECRRLAKLTPDQEAMVEAFERNAGETPGWR
jgi:hypothetical protein